MPDNKNQTEINTHGNFILENQADEQVAFPRADAREGMLLSVGHKEANSEPGDSPGAESELGDFDSSGSTITSSYINGTGAPPSNTAPSNYIELENDSQILRFGVDSIYLSYQGYLASSWDKKLEGLKLSAQSQEDTEKSVAQVNIGNHLFEVSARGYQRFPYVLVDNCFRIQLSRASSKSMPLAYVQLSSELLTTLSVQEAVNRLNVIIRTFGLVKGEPQISRVDIFADFTYPLTMDSWGPLHWVTRAHKIWLHYERRKFSGWSIGLGGNIAARLYNKTLELEKSKKEYLKPLWNIAGWDGKCPIWRLEFEFHRQVLKEMDILEIEPLIKHSAGLWQYACNNWLRLAIPNESDSNQTRWPNHPLWDFLIQVDWKSQQPGTLKRIRKERIPSDDSLFINGLGGITSFMARHGIEDLGEGLGEFFAHAECFHEHKSRSQDKGLSHYIQEKVNFKARKYNTLDNRDKKQLKKEMQKQAKAYRKVKNGG
jgi:hypothetical protein